MIPENSTLHVSIEWWRNYQNLLIQAVQPLTADQLALRLGAQRSAREIVAHMVMARAWYLHGVMGEGGTEMEPLIGWDAPDAPLRSSAELLTGLDQTWQLLTTCMARWTPTDMTKTFYINWLDRDMPCSWVVYHILEHEIHHGGELSFTLGYYGLPGVDV